MAGGFRHVSKLKTIWKYELWGIIIPKWLNMVKLFNIKSSWTHAYACLLAGKNMCKKTTHVPLHITGSRAEPYTPEISADSIRALLLACWPGAEELILNIGQAEKENTLHFFIKHIKSYHKAHSMDGSKVKGELLGIWKGSQLPKLWLPYPPSIGGPPGGILAILPARLAGNSWTWWSFHLSLRFFNDAKHQMWSGKTNTVPSGFLWIPPAWTQLDH